MKEKIRLNGEVVEYELRTRKPGAKGVRTISLVVHPEKGLVVTIPRRATKQAAENFIREKSVWVLKALERYRKLAATAPKKLTPVQVKECKEKARTLAAARLEYFNFFYNFSYRQIRIKDQKTRWGSCSGKGNLNFNYRIVLLPPPLADYIIVHELCHIAQMNHSSKFWTLVAKTIPDYAERRRQLRSHSVQLG